VKCLTIEPERFKQHFPDSGFTIQHHLAGLMAFELPQLLALSRRLPAESVEYNAGTLVPGQDPAATPQNGLSVEETIERIEQCQSWLVLKHVERDPLYKALMDACLDTLYPHALQTLSDLHDRAAFIFISSPGSVTPFHFDPEHNFLLQIRGGKTMHQFDKYDRTILPEAAIEEKYVDASSHRNQPFQDAFQAKAQTFTLQAGDGLFVPINAPHWVENGKEVSISFSITFHSAQSDRIARLYKFNGLLRRKLGITPTPVGQMPRKDALKHDGIMALRKLKKLLA
jgi:hypothetical protein